MKRRAVRYLRVYLFSVYLLKVLVLSTREAVLQIMGTDVISTQTGALSTVTFSRKLHA